MCIGQALWQAYFTGILHHAGRERQLQVVHPYYLMEPVPVILASRIQPTHVIAGHDCLIMYQGIWRVEPARCFRFLVGRS